jgi:hypothetical protein
MRGRRIFRALKVMAIAIVAFTAFGFVVTQLWNYLMPGLFGLRMITFWQAVGMMLLGRLLFGGFRPGRGGFGWRGQMLRRWEQMTPEERQQFREGLRGRCGQARTPAPSGNSGTAL